MIKSYKDLKVYQLSYELAMDMFWITKNFPKEELYSLTDQLRRSARSVVANIVEGWSKRHYETTFKKHLIDSIGSCNETKLWLDLAFDCKYIIVSEHRCYTEKLDEIGKMLHGLLHSWHTFSK